MLRAFDDGRLFATTSGDEAPWVIALHGWGRSSADFAAALAGIDALAVDLPGFGSSPPPPEPWGSEQYALAVRAVLDGCRRPVVVLGHSFGGRVAVQLAARWPEEVAALVLTGVPLVRPPGQARRGPAPAFRLGRVLHRRGVLPDAAMEWLRQRYGSADYKRASGVMRQVHVRLVNESYDDVLARISSPVDLVWGADDDQVPPAVAEQSAALLRAAGTEATVTLVPGGHLLPVTAPDALRRAVLDRRPPEPAQT